jgi:hypothetical protein
MCNILSGLTASTLRTEEQKGKSPGGFTQKTGSHTLQYSIPNTCPINNHDSIPASYINLSLLQYYTTPQLSRFYSAVLKNKNIN